MPKFTIIFVTPSLKAGGGNRVFIELASRLKGNFYTTILRPNNSINHIGSYESSRVDQTVVGSYAKTFLGKIINVFFLFSKLNQRFKNDPFTIVVISEPIISSLSFLIKSRYSNRVMSFIQADDYNLYNDGYVLKFRSIEYIYKLFCKSVFKKQYIHLFNSRFTYDRFVAVSKRVVPCENIHPGIDTNIFNAKHRGVNTDINLCLFARKHPMKGFDDFTRAWNLLPEDLKQTISHVYIVTQDKIDSPTIRQAIIVNPSSDKEIVETLNKSQIFISTSWWEGFSLPPLEAMACGCAVISSNSKGILEYAVDDENCLLYCPKNYNQLAEKLCLLLRDDELREKLSSSGINTAKNFSWANTSDQFEQKVAIYQRNILKAFKTP